MSDLTAERPPLDLDRLVSPVDWSVEVVDAAPSTNALVAERARSGAAGEGLVVVAEHQTAGRGRLDRTWETPARSALTLSRPVARPVVLPTCVIAQVFSRAQTERKPNGL